jgi:cbb3-type cytochrome oxidase maturation protein
MDLLPAAIVILIISIIAGAFSLAAFLWAVRAKQFSIKHMNEGALVIFDSVEKVGTPTDQTFAPLQTKGDEQTKG